MSNNIKITLKSEEVLNRMGIKNDTYPADACFNSGGEYIGTYSEDRETVCIMIEDNLLPEEQENFEACILQKETIEEIAYTCKKLITNFGCAVHSYTMKTVKPFTNLKIVKTHG